MNRLWLRGMKVTSDEWRACGELLFRPSTKFRDAPFRFKCPSCGEVWNCFVTPIQCPKCEHRPSMAEGVTVTHRGRAGGTFTGITFPFTTEEVSQ